MSKLTQREKILEILKEAGEKGVHSFYFYKNFIPTFSQRIGELKRIYNYDIESIKKGSKGTTYILNQ